VVRGLDGVVDPARIAASAAYDADIICLQEVAPTSPTCRQPRRGPAAALMHACPSTKAAW
jgi:endonuclease/exonuclease/phosphatase family metal-dependent hydrolase